MLKEKDLVPGRVIVNVQRSILSWNEPYVMVKVAWLIIGFSSQVKRRHARKSAPKLGWHILLLRFGSGERVLRDTVLTPNDMSSDAWKRLF